MSGLFDDYETPSDSDSEKRRSLDTPSKGKRPSAAEQAYLRLQITEQVQRIIRQQGRSATPEFLIALGNEIIAQAGGRAR